MTASLPHTATAPIQQDVEEDWLDGVEEIDVGEIIHRPDGYHWISADSQQEFGPFETLELVLADMQAAAEGTYESGESLEEAEDEIGISDWIDPDTGELAEGQSTPHFHAE